MRNRMLGSFITITAIVLGLSLTPYLSAQQETSEEWSPPRTPNGHPDLQGIWTNHAEMNVPFERPVELGELTVLDGEALAQELEARAARREEQAPTLGGETGAGPIHWLEFWDSTSSRTSFVTDPPDGRIPPLTPEAEKRAEMEESRRPLRRPGVGGLDDDHWGDRFLWERCITRGMPGSIMPGIYNSNAQIVQSSGHVVLLYEMIHDARVIPLDGRPHVDPDVRQWMGDSRGRWEGDTLVVETTNFNEKVIYRQAADNLHVTERFTLLDADTLYYEATIEDATTWTRPWTFASFLKRDNAQPRIFEYACHEGNYGMRNILSAGKADREQAVQEAAAAEK